MANPFRLALLSLCSITLSPVSAIALGTQTLTVKALDAGSGAVIQSVTASQPIADGPGGVMTMGFVKLDTPPHVLYSGVGQYNRFGTTRHSYQASARCVSIPSCVDLSVLPSLFEFEANLWLELGLGGGVRAEMSILEMLNVEGTLTSLDSGNSIPLSLGQTLAIDDIEAIAERSCRVPPGDCLFVAEWQSLPGALSIDIFFVEQVPEPSTAALTALGLATLALRRRARLCAHQ